MTYVRPQHLPTPTAAHVVLRPHRYPVDVVRWAVNLRPQNAQSVLGMELANPKGPRYTLTQWLKRNRVHNPTTRVIHTR